MNNFENRNELIDRVQKEIIGPGSDIFISDADYSDEIIEGKPLQRYFSAILFPKQTANDDDEGKDLFSEEPEDHIITPNAAEEDLDGDEKEKPDGDNDSDDEDTVPKYNLNAFYPSHFGFSFCVSKNCTELNLQVSFGNYRKAGVEEIALPYNGTDLNLLPQFGFDQFVAYDEEKKTLKQKRKIKKKEKGQFTNEYLALQSAFKDMSAEHRNSAIFKHLTKLFFKDKYKRYKNEISFSSSIAELLRAEKNHIKITLSELPDLNSGHWHKDNRDNIILHLKLYNKQSDKYFIKTVIENKFIHKRKEFAFFKAKLNQLALFQTEIKVTSEFLLPFRDYQSHLYKTDEDKMLDYLFRDKLAYGVGHNTSCTWEECEQDKNKPTWIKTTFLPTYNVKGQSTETDKIASEILNIRSLSSFGKSRNQIISDLKTLSDAYKQWIIDEDKGSNGDTFGKINVEKCKEIHKRIERGITLLSENEVAFKAFQFANASIYIQMLQADWHFNKKDGYEIYERAESPQHPYAEYSTIAYPNNKREPSWRPFQLAFILQCIPSFVDPTNHERDLVDLLYFPTGGGKTEAYLAVSAFLIFWRRLTYNNSYDGVNIIMRYTLRLLSAQQFERATRLILACEFVRQNNSVLGNERISIGFWIGGTTIPNKHKTSNGSGAYDKFKRALNLLNAGKYINSPFQVSNCQWCNTKLISKNQEADSNFVFGHRHNENRLTTFCNNPKCIFHENYGGLPIVLIDEDIYRKPPTMLFGTVDKFAQLAWEGEAHSLFNYKGNRKPELIIQDELHLLNGPLGSLVGLFENVILSLCTDADQSPKIIASTATIKNVESQIRGLYGREARIFPQFATNSDDTFFSKEVKESKRRYIGILPTGKTTVMTNLQLLSALLYARLEIWEKIQNKKDVDHFWTLLSYFKSLKEIGRFSNKISSELRPTTKQLQVRHLKNHGDLTYNYSKLSYRNIELTSRIPNEKIKKNLDKLEIQFNGNLKDHKAFDIVLATNMISVGLDVGRLGIMIMNGMPPNTAEFIQASSRVARKSEGIVLTMFDPFNARDLSYFEDFVQFHKTFYRQVEPLSVTPFADSALDKMLFTLMVAFFRQKMNFSANNRANALLETNVKAQFQNQFEKLFTGHPYAKNEMENITSKINRLIQSWQYKIESVDDLKYFWYQNPKASLMKPVQERKTEDDVLIAMQSMRNVEPNSEIVIKQM